MSNTYKCLGAVYTAAGVVENHTGNQMIGTERSPLTKEHLNKIGRKFQEEGYEPRALKLHKLCGKTLRKKNGERLKAYVLHVPKGVKAFGLKGKQLKHELESVNPDKKFLNPRTKKVQNKRARYNFNIADHHLKQTPEYHLGKGTVVSFEEMPKAKQVRDGLSAWGEELNIPNMQELNFEANVYHSEDSGIGFHGDTERCMVIGANMGKKRCIEFQAFEEALPTGKCVSIELRNNDMYLMCVEACGHNWKDGGYKLPHFRHRAGYPKWLDKNTKQLKRKYQKMRQKRAEGPPKKRQRK